MNAARQANVAPDQVARILVAGQNRTDVGGSRRPKDLVEAIHSLPYFVASAVADKEFTWVHATEAKIFNPVVTRLMQLVEVDPAPPAVKYNWSWGGSVTIVTTVRRPIHQHRRRATRIRAARHRVDGRRRQIPRAHARTRSCQPREARRSWACSRFRAGEERLGTDAPAGACPS